MTQIRLVITGATGWLGRELASVIFNRWPWVEVLLVGRSQADVALAGRILPVFPWNNKTVEDWAPTHLAHLAFSTKERSELVPRAEYLATNRTISDNFLSLFRLQSVRGALYVSSGAAVAQLDSAYGLLKAEDEVRFMDFARSHSKPLGIARIWSVSGRYCTKPSRFLFANLIQQALDQRSTSISVTADHFVWRRYVDAGQFLGSAMTRVWAGETGIWDSGGQLVSNVDLAMRVRDLLAPEKTVKYSLTSQLSDHYYVQKDDMSAFMAPSGTKPMTIDQQILYSSVELPRL